LIRREIKGTNKMSTAGVTNKENNKNIWNTSAETSKKFTRGNATLQGKIFDINTKEVVHQFWGTVKVIANYVGQEYTHGGDVRFMIENLQDFNFQAPADPPLYSLIWGQSSKSTQSNMETHQEFQECKAEYESLKF
jgi:hypothetical protein